VEIEIYVCTYCISEQSNDSSFVSHCLKFSISLFLLVCIRSAPKLMSDYVPRSITCMHVFTSVSIIPPLNNSVSLARTDPFSVVHITKIYIRLLPYRDFTWCLKSASFRSSNISRSRVRWCDVKYFVKSC